jgi:hypothetical protein
MLRERPPLQPHINRGTCWFMFAIFERETGTNAGPYTARMKSAEQ